MMFFRRLEYLLPWRRRAAERDMQEELRSIAAMADPRELGNLTLAAEDARAQWGWTWLEQTLQDVRYAVRTLAKAPGFTLAAVLSLAIGIGANTALFTLINTVMWKLLPVRDPEHLLTIAAQYPTGVTYAFTYQQYRDLPRSRRRARPRRLLASAAGREHRRTGRADDGRAPRDGRVLPAAGAAPGRSGDSSTRATTASRWGIRSPC